MADILVYVQRVQTVRIGDARTRTYVGFVESAFIQETALLVLSMISISRSANMTGIPIVSIVVPTGRSLLSADRSCRQHNGRAQKVCGVYLTTRLHGYNFPQPTCRGPVCPEASSLSGLV